MIPYKAKEKNPPRFFAKVLYRARARIEQLVGKLKRFERIALRCEKTARNFGSFVALVLGLHPGEIRPHDLISVRCIPVRRISRPRPQHLAHSRLPVPISSPRAPGIFMALQLTRRNFAKLAGLAAFTTAVDAGKSSAQAPDPARNTVVLFENVRVFDGVSSQLSGPSNVLVRGNLIERVSTSPIPVDRRAETRIFAGDGRTLMPGLIDAHWHAFLRALFQLWQRRLPAT